MSEENQKIESEKSPVPSENEAQPDSPVSNSSTNWSGIFTISMAGLSAVALVIAGYLWWQLHQLQSLVNVSGGVKDIVALKNNNQRTEQKLVALDSTIQQMSSWQKQIQKNGQSMASLDGQFKELRQSTKEGLSAAESKLEQSGKEITLLQGGIKEIREQANSKISLIEKNQHTFELQIQQSIAAIEEDVNRDRVARIMGEVAHYLKVADDRLQIDKQVRVAESALVAAQQRLKSLPIKRYQNVLKSVEKDIAALKQIEQPDINGISNLISSIQTQLQSVPIKGMERPADLMEKKPVNNSKGIWNRALTSIGNGLKQVVVVRHGGEPDVPLLSPEQTFFLYQNLRIKLESVRAALLRQDQKEFHQGVLLAHQWAKKYLAPVKKAEEIFASLDNMAKINIDPKLPGIHKTLQILQDELAIKGHKRSSGKTGTAKQSVGQTAAKPKQTTHAKRAESEKVEAKPVEANPVEATQAVEQEPVTKDE